jgi:hypothetical protein
MLDLVSARSAGREVTDGDRDAGTTDLLGREIDIVSLSGLLAGVLSIV